MDPITMMAIGAALGLAKNEMVDKPREKRQRKLAAETQRLSPWTGMQANPIQEADPFGNALQFGVTGAQMGALAQNKPGVNNTNFNTTFEPQAEKFTMPELGSSAKYGRSGWGR